MPGFNPQQKQAPSFGSVQNNFVYRLRQFIMNDQFTIVEDMPANKPVRTAPRMSAKNTQYNVFLIRISANNFEADLELFEGELNQLAVACPKDIKNFKGVTLAFDGRRWQYITQETQGAQHPATPAQIQTQANPNANLEKLIAGITAINSIGTDVLVADMTKMADKITPGKAQDLIQQAKAQGYIYEQNGVYKVS